MDRQAVQESIDHFRGLAGDYYAESDMEMARYYHGVADGMERVLRFDEPDYLDHEPLT